MSGRWSDGEDKYFRKTSTNWIHKGVAKTVQTKFDAATLHSNQAVAANTGMVDDGTGVKEVFREHLKISRDMPFTQVGGLSSDKGCPLFYANFLINTG